MGPLRLTKMFRVASKLVRPAAACAASCMSVHTVLAEQSHSIDELLDNAKSSTKARVKNSLYLEAAKQGSLEAKYHLSQNLINGFGLDKNPAEGMIYLQEAADGGHPQALYQLSVMYKLGRSVPKDEKKAKELLGVAANHGSPEALHAMSGQLYVRSKNNLDVTDEMLDRVTAGWKKFNAIDANNDGKITRAEWISHFGSDVGYDLYDLDHDGYISRAEFVAATVEMGKA